RLKRARTEIVGVEAARLTAPEQLEREILLTVIDGNLFFLDTARFPFTNPAWYVDRLDPDVYLHRDYPPLAQRLKGYLGYARAIPQVAAAIRANLRTPMPASYIERGIGAFGGFADFYRHDVGPIFAAVADPAAQKELAAADAAAADAMDELRNWLKGER